MQANYAFTWKFFFVDRPNVYTTAKFGSLLIAIIKLSLLNLVNFIKKEALAPVFSCEFSEVYKNAFL